MKAEKNIHAESNAIIAKAMEEGMNDMLPVVEPVKKAAKPKAAAKAPAKAAPKAEPKAPAKPNKVVKAEAKAVLFKAASGASYELSKDADPKLLKAAAADAAKALGAIGKKDADLLSHYMTLGKFQSEAAPLFKSSKLYGQFLAAELPASQELDPALRSNCKGVYEALKKAGAEGSDILSVLGVNRIEDYKSKNPTVIKRDYKAKAEEVAKAKAAEEAGKSVEELEAEAEAKANAESEAAKEKAKKLIEEFAKSVAAKAMAGRKDEAETDVVDVLYEALFGKKKEAVEMIDSLIEPAH